MLIQTLGKYYFLSDSESEQTDIDGGALSDYFDDHSDHETDDKQVDFSEKLQDIPLLRDHCSLEKTEITSVIVICITILT